MPPPDSLQQHADELAMITGCEVTISAEGTQLLVVVKNCPLPAGTYSQPRSDVLLMTDEQYPLSAMDMFWMEEPVTLADGEIPHRAEVIEEHLGRRWRRWSRHRNGAWDPTIDGLISHWALIEECWAMDRERR